MNNHNEDDAKLRIQRIFNYIKELTRLRTPPVSQIEKYEWSLRFSNLPTYPSVETYATTENEADNDGIILKVRRPIETSCPKPNQDLVEWLENGWEKVENELAPHLGARNIAGENGAARTESFTDSQSRVQSYKEWSEKRSTWRSAELPARHAASLFADFFKLHGQMQRESEKYQLFIADGNLIWESAVGSVDHPLILKKVELEFYSAVPEFIIRETDAPSEMYTALLRHHELDGRAVTECNENLKLQTAENEIHPLSATRADAFLKFTIQRLFQDGLIVEDRKGVDKSKPSLYRDPVLFLGLRTQGFADALDKYVTAIPNLSNFSEALVRMVGFDVTTSESAAESDSEGSKPTSPPIDFLLTKPANQEQERVITRLEQNGSVLVQGPPGTGKSHTIANIIGHFLAQGKTVLVSSHTSKALRVVRDKVEKNLQPLCVAALDNDNVSKSQLEESINGIVSYGSKTDRYKLTDEISTLNNNRIQLRAKIADLEKAIFEIRKGEYTDIVVGGIGISPSEAARQVNQYQKTHGWIPGLVSENEPLPLSQEELAELYFSNQSISPIYEACISEGLVDASKILAPDEFKEIVKSLEKLENHELNENLWLNRNQDSELLKSAISNLKKAVEIFNSHSWLYKVVEDANHGGQRTLPWTNLVVLVRDTNDKISNLTDAIFKHGPKVESDDIRKSLDVCNEILLHLKSGKKLGALNLFFKSSWKLFIQSSKVDSGRPSSVEHFAAIGAHLLTEVLRTELKQRWERQVVSIGGPQLSAVEPELTALEICEKLEMACHWPVKIWGSIEVELTAQGFSIPKASEKFALKSSLQGMQKTKSMVDTLLVPTLEARCNMLRRKELNDRKSITSSEITLNYNKENCRTTFLNDLSSSFKKGETELYEKAYNKLLEVRSYLPIFEKRKHLLKKLHDRAPSWAKAVELRAGIHGLGVVPENPALAWKIAQYTQELDKRTLADYSAMQSKLNELKRNYAKINTEYVEKLAWRFQLKRTGLAENQALTGWQHIQSKITKSGKGVRDAVLRREAQQSLKKCKSAVPVWIMPLSRVFESFDLVEQNKFDILILDEASQSDVTALAAFAIAKQVIVVGDDKQVTPSAVGVELNKIQSLIDELLKNVPNKLSYDPRTSVYHLAKQSFGERIRLVEHFRCVPDIIEFSNMLSYDGEIRPLRESSSSNLKTSLVAHRVVGGVSDGDKNELEANEIASIVAAMTSMPEYASSSIGVICMVGQSQALVIDTILQRRLSTEVYQKHSLLCGNPSQFQGDERDVILISIVDSCEEPPLSLRQTEDFEKRFNVAGSRARNQMWVVHSLNPSTDLKPNDLRLKLIKHAENPKALAEKIEKTQRQADPKSSVFEPAVIKDLMLKGFKVLPQHDVGAYTIDMVVVGNKSEKIAIECDGDRYHPIEKLPDDIQRQSVLERLGWKFIRIRGSEYFRNREAAIERVVSELEKMGVARTLGSESDSVQHIEARDSVIDEVIRKASEIRAKWEAEPIEEVAKPKTGGGRWGKGKSTTSPITATSAPLSTNSEVQEKVEVSNLNKNLGTEFVSTSNGSATTLKPVQQMLFDENLIKEAHIDISFKNGEEVTFLKRQGFEVIDKRKNGGALWVIDHPEFRKVLPTLKQRGIDFKFAANGSGSTADRPGWYFKIHR